MANPRIIGLLGGSFNPAHAGHVAVSREAMKTLGLHSVWWLVSPQNPLKSHDDMASYDKRIATAQRVAASHSAIHISNIEQQHGTQYTVDTLEVLIRTYPNVRFVWLMGADNLAQMHQWHHWRHIFSMVHIAVYDRRPHSMCALRSKAARTYEKHRVSPRLLTASPLPAWCFIHGKRHPLSATKIRNSLGF
ncbi:MAG: nicotinate-nucleotide adenylyltransferase [Alphaproteobacteria bacterium]|nr:nicotinate-nucleotide adenylyltransferase [Alphaproteobacteria bacterium]